MASICRTFVVQNRLGLHMRAAALLVQVASKYDAEITITKEGQTVNGKSIIGLMMLAAGQGSSLDIEAAGPQAAEAIEAITSLVERRFDEE